MKVLEIRSSSNLLKFPLVPIVPHYEQTYFCIHIKQNFIQKLEREKQKSLAMTFNLKFSYKLTTVTSCRRVALRLQNNDFQYV